MPMPMQANVFSGLDLVAILNTGVTGFAVLMLYISYRLISASQEKVFEKDVSTFPDESSFQGWRDLVRIQVRQTYFFMALAALFFFGGVGVLLYQFQAKSEIVLLVQPYEEPFPSLFVQGEPRDITTTGHAPLTVQSGRVVEVRSMQIYKRLTDLESELAKSAAELNALRESLRSVTSRAAEASNEQGL